MRTRRLTSNGLAHASLAALICVALALPYARDARAFENCFLQIEGVDGGSAQRLHPHAIEITAYSWEEKNVHPASSGERRGGTGGRAQMDYLRASMRAGKASPALMLLVANNGYSRQAVLECTGSDASGAAAPIHRWSLSDVTINSFQSGWVGGQNNSDPVDQIEIGFVKIGYEYVPAGIRVEWDSSRNTGGYVSGGASGQQSIARPPAPGPH